MIWTLPIIAGVLGRLDGFGGLPDRFLPLGIFNKWPKKGINYTRYLIGLFIWVYTMNWIYILTYALAVSVPYGEKHWWMKAGLVSWFGIGLIYGIASLSWANALFCGMLLVAFKFYDMDQAWLELSFYGLGVLYFIFK